MVLLREISLFSEILRLLPGQKFYEEEAEENVYSNEKWNVHIKQLQHDAMVDDHNDYDDEIVFCK